MKQGASRPGIIASYFAVAMAAMLIPLCAASEKSIGQTPGQSNSPAHILDGKKFTGKAGAKGKGVHHEDILTFSNGMFESSACVPLTFSSGPYTATTKSGLIHFTAELISTTRGKLIWKGTLKGDTLEATFTWIQKRWLWTTQREYWFKGHRIK